MSNDSEKLINIALGLMDSEKGANLVCEVANLLRKMEDMQAKVDDYDRLATLARNRRHVLEEIAGSKALTATPQQFVNLLQGMAKKACEDYTFAGYDA